MTSKNTLTNRLLSILLCLALLVSYLPANMLNAFAAPVDTRVSDPSTMDDWKDFFLPADGSLSTENAGGVWTNKSVFMNDTAFDGTGIAQDNVNSFLVALSAIASNKTVTGLSNAPADTMLVLDVSGSMRNHASQLVSAANETIHSLLTMNSQNRVGVVLYSGSSSDDTNANAAVLLLPLGRYTTSSYSGYGQNRKPAYLRISDNTVSLWSTVEIEGTSNTPSTINVRKAVTGATYIQKGIMKAMEQFIADSNSTTVENDVLGTVKRMPFVVLMSDGAPTLGSTDFSNPGQYDMGNGSSDTTQLSFVTQLTAAYAKQKIEKKYQSECLFYTLGLGVSNNSNAVSVLDPANSSKTIQGYWTTYLEQAVNSPVAIEYDRQGNVETSVIKAALIDEKQLVKNYVKQYFSSNQASSLSEAFKSIVAQISMQSKYFPTLVSKDEELSGYVSFVDRIGAYMNVTDIKGILIHNTLFSGADLASNFVTGGGNLGTVENPTALGDEMVWAVQARLGLATPDQARTLITLAYQHGQLSYTSAEEFSNYIGWYANAAGEFLGFWYEGMTTMPDPTDPSLTDANRPAYIIKSYGYLGEVNEEQGVAKSDMMYATVQLRQEILTGEETVVFAVPAALIPIVTYNVTLDDERNLTDLTVSGATDPIRLVYEVALDPAINAYTLKEIVSAEYLAANTNADGSVNFYTNQYQADNTTGYGKVNTYSYFNPSRQNDRYYYTENTRIYSDTNGTLYQGTSQPSGTMYRQRVVYTRRVDGSFATEVVYRPLTADMLANAKYGTDTTTNEGYWYVPKGSVRADFERFAVYKGGLDTYDESQNLTGTLIYSNIPFVDTENHHLDDTGYNFIVGATLGNNGKLSMVPATGIVLSKQMAEGATEPTKPFAFHMTNLTNSGDNSSYPAVKVLADGTRSDTVVKFTAGEATVSLNAGEKLYISGMTAGQIIRIAEEETVEYVVQTVNGTAAAAADVMVKVNELTAVSFVNEDRGAGNLTIAKEVEHDFGTDYQIPADKVFTITVTLSGVGTANATFGAKLTGSDITSITTDASGRFTVQLKHNQQLQLLELPAGTVATVVEENPGAGFTAKYWINGQEAVSGQVTVEADKTVSVIVLNDYTPGRVYPVNITVSGSKLLSGRDWMADDVFQFQLQKRRGLDDWQILSTTQVKGTDASKTFSFTDAFAAEAYTEAGTYYYRVVELIPENPLGGVTYDRTVHAFAVDVADLDMDGTLEITAVRPQRADTTHVTQTTENSWHVEVDFTNTYSTSGTATVTIDLNKLVNNESGSPLALLTGFEFGLFEEGKTVPTFRSEKTTDSGFARLVLTYEKAGTYKYTLKEIAPDPIPAGWVYSTEQVAITVVVSDDGDGTLSAVIYKGDEAAGATISLSTVFTNTYKLLAAELPIDFVTKQLDGRNLKNEEFTFAVKDLDGNVVLTGKNNTLGKVVFDGTLKFTKVGTYFYNIVETSADGNGVIGDKNIYRITVTVKDNGAGSLAASYVLVNAEGNQIVFKNTYTTQSVSNAIGGIKFLEGRELMNDEFTFRLTEALDANGNVAEGAVYYDVGNTADGRFTFPTLTYTQPGTYHYLVTEVDDGNGVYGITYDKTAFVVSVVIRDDGMGKLVVDQVNYAVKGNGGVNGIVFVNKYLANPTVAQITGDKTLSGKVLTGGQYSFELYLSNEKWEQGDLLETVTNLADGSFTFTPFTMETAGSYYYLVKEVNGGQTIDGVTYDARVYRVRVDVTDNLRGQLNAAIFVFDQNNLEQDAVEFVNVYKVVGTDQITINGEKVLEGWDLADGAFTFELYKANSRFVIEGGAIDTTVNMDGRFSFTRNYTSDDVGNTYYYVVKEANAGQILNGITYSEQMYFITVQVTDNGVGGIETTTLITDGVNVVQTMSFKNYYDALDTVVAFAGNKVLENHGLEAGEFLFDLYMTGADFIPHSAAIQSVKNLADGSFAFEDVDLVEAKTYYFVIKENSQNPLGGISYDLSEYHITVVVKDDGQGNLYVESETMVHVTDGQSAPAEEIRFVNTYSTQNVSVTLGGTKKLTGRDLAAGEFTFLLEQTDASFNPIGGHGVLLAVNQADGSFLFDALTFTAAGTYYFIVTEDSSEKLERVTYDDTVFQVTIVVTDDGEGHLVAAQPQIVKKGTTQNTDIVFNNIYTPRPEDITVDITVNKTVLNLGSQKIGPEGFEFILENTATGEKLTYKTDTAGTALFTLQFTEDDIGNTYTYKLYEVNNGRAHVTYSDRVYDVTIAISLNANNELVATVKMDGSAVSEAVASFENKYDYTPKDISVYVAVDKTIVNLGSEKLSPEGFTFVLENTVTGEKQYVTTNADGVALYDLIYTAQDIGKTFTYKLYELNDGKAYVTYSTTVYYIEVTISLDANEELKADILLNGVTVGLVDAAFENVYDFTPDDLAVQIDVDKTVSNLGSEEIGPDGFQFILENTATGEQKTVTTDASGRASFTLTYTAADIGKTFSYILYEVNDHRAHVSYSTVVYTITAEITLNAEGKLVATMKRDGVEVDDVRASFENTYDYTPGDLPVQLKVTKTVQNLGSEKISAEGFRFVLEDRVTGDRWYAVSDHSGNAVFDLTFSAADIDKTFHYELYELDEGQAHVTYSTKVYLVYIAITLNAEGNLEAEIKVDGVPVESVNAEFENIYDFTPADLPVDFQVDKTVVNLGSEKLSPEGFEFMLENVTTGEKQTVKTDAAGKAVFGMVYTAADIGHTFIYRLYEIDGGMAHVTYSQLVYEISVEITLNSEGKLVALTKVNGAVKNGVVAAFENTYDFTPDDLIVDFTVDKTVVNLGSEEITPEGFTFVLENLQTGERKVLTTNAAGSAVFEMVYTAADIGKTFTYELHEVNDHRAHVTYSQLVYTISVEISLSAEGKLVALIKVNGTETNEVVASFENTYDYTPGDLAVDIEVDKTVANLGSESIGPDGFEFVLEDQETGERWTAKTDKNGIAVIGLTFSAADIGKTFHYRLFEVNDGRAYVTYSTKVYDVTITITLNAEGNLEATIEDARDVLAEARFAFENTYDYTPEDVTVEIEVNKTVTNLGSESIGPEGFEFILENLQTGEKESIKTNSAGVAVFGKVYTAADVGKTFTYKLYEINDGRENVTYSTKVYLVSVSISLDAQLKLVTEVRIDSELVEDAKVAFENTYDYTPRPDDLSLEITVNKTVENKGTESIGPKDFQFLLENLENGAKQTVKTDENGIAQFALLFTADDVGKTFRFRLSEVNDGRAYITYSEAVYDISITIIRNSDNKLEAELIMNEEAVQQLRAGFVNVFDYTEKDPGGNPGTGDSFSLSLWVALLFVSGGCMVATSCLAKKKEQN